jgi:hypothetical protein
MGIELFKKDAEGIPIVSPSQINLLMTCGAKWRYKYVEKMKDSMGIDAKLGNFVHSALEQALISHQEGEGVGVNDVHRFAYESALHYFTDPQQVAELRGADATEGIANADYYSRMCGDLAVVGWRWFLQSGLKVVSVERSIERVKEYKGNKIKIGGRLDLLAQDKDGAFVIVDWKTAGKAPFKNAKGGFVMDRSHANQQLIYAQCLKEQGIDVKRVGTLKMTKTKVPQAYFAYVDVTGGMLAWSESIVEAAINMVYTDTLPPNPLGAGVLCAEKYCFAYHLCPGSSKHVNTDEPAE